MRRAIFLSLASMVCAVFAGCAGYHIGPAKPVYLAKIHSLAIPEFKNLSLEPRIESLVTDSVIRQFQQDGTFTIAGEDDADAVLEGAITSVTRSRARSVRGNIEATSEFNLVVVLNYKLTNRVTGENLDSGAVGGSTSFFVGADLQQQERQAVVLAAENAAIQLTGKISEGF